MIDQNIPNLLVQNVLLPIGAVSARSIPPGMSGASVYRCRLESKQEFALKRWPDGTQRARIEEVHRVIGQSKQAGCTLVPGIHKSSRWNKGGLESIFLANDGAYWDLLEWKSGLPAAKDAPREQIESGAAAIAEFHASVRSLGIRSQPAPAVTTRLKRIKELDRQIPQAIAVSRIDRIEATESEITAPVRDACQLVQWKWDEVRSRILRSLNQYRDVNAYNQYVLRDVHRDHVLFHDRRATGLIDFDAARIDTPATDLARWAGSFLGGRSDAAIVWEAAVAGFCHESTLNSGSAMKIDPNMARNLCFATIWISLANWLVWILGEQRRFPAGPKAVAERLRELIAAASLDG